MVTTENEQEDTMHVGLINISIPLVWHLLKLPEDYQIRGGGVDLNRNCFGIIVEHESLPAVKEGDILPDIMPIYTRKDLPEHLDQVELVDIKTSEG